jgi:hypothetical protein
MAEGKRPGGLTALAVLNFVFAGLGILGLLALFALIGTADKALTDANVEHVSAGALYAGIAFGLLRMALMLAAGIGYLGQKRVLGRIVGNLYGALGLLSTIIDVAVVHSGVGIATIIFVIYPVLTLILLNTTFKDDLVN